jgi:hydrogenase maturation protease
MEMRTLILGLGNPLRGDDGVGVHVAAAVSAALPRTDAVEVDVETGGGLAVMERLVGYDGAILVDALVSGRHAPGTVLHLTENDVATQHTVSSHGVSLATALRLGRELGLALPRRVPIVAVEIQPSLEFADGCTPEVEASVQAAAAAVREEWQKLEDADDLP